MDGSVQLVLPLYKTCVKSKPTLKFLGKYSFVTSATTVEVTIWKRHNFPNIRNIDNLYVALNGSRPKWRVPFDLLGKTRFVSSANAIRQGRKFENGTTSKIWTVKLIRLVVGIQILVRLQITHIKRRNVQGILRKKQFRQFCHYTIEVKVWKRHNFQNIWNMQNVNG